MSKETETLVTAIADMTKIMEGMQAMCAKQAQALKECQMDLRDMIKTNVQLSKIVEEYRADYKEIFQGYRDELRSAKEMIFVLNQQQKEKGSSNRSDVNINL